MIQYKIFYITLACKIKIITKEWGLMTRTKLSGTRIQNTKRIAYIRLKRVSRICFLSQLARSRPVLEEKTSTFTESKALDAEPPQSKKCGTMVHKTINVYLHSLIRIKATDRDGNSIEVTY